MTFLAVLFACYFELPVQDSSWVTAQPSAVTCHRHLNLCTVLVNLISSLGEDGQIWAASLLPQPTTQPVLLLTATSPSARR